MEEEIKRIYKIQIAYIVRGGIHVGQSRTDIGKCREDVRDEYQHKKLILVISYALLHLDADQREGRKYESTDIKMNNIIHARIPPYFYKDNLIIALERCQDHFTFHPKGDGSML